MAITIPKQHYVTIQYRKDASTESGLLGFASPYTKDAAFEKRRATQESWAYGGYGTQFDIGDDGSILPNNNSKIDRFTLFATKCYPIITDNEPIEGFEVAKSVRRSGGWGGSGNVVWRVADPRGFELEISSENFARIIDCTTVENGKILGKCLWGREGPKNILLPEASDIYQEAVKMTAKVNTKISLKDVQVGDTVEIMSTAVAKDDLVCQYFGKYYFLEVDQLGDGVRRGSGKFSFNKRVTEKYLMKSAKTGQYFVLNTPKVVNIITKISTPLVKSEVANEVTMKIGQVFKIKDADDTVIVSATKFDLSTVTVNLVPIAETIIGDQWPSVGKYDSHVDAIVCKLDGKVYVASLLRGGYNEPNTPTLTEITLDLPNSAFQINRNETHNPGYRFYGPQTTYTNIVRTDFEISKLEKFRFVVTANGITGKVYRLGYF